MLFCVSVTFIKLYMMKQIFTTPLLAAVFVTSTYGATIITATSENVTAALPAIDPATNIDIFPNGDINFVSIDLADNDPSTTGDQGAAIAIDLTPLTLPGIVGDSLFFNFSTAVTSVTSNFLFGSNRTLTSDNAFSFQISNTGQIFTRVQNGTTLEPFLLSPFLDSNMAALVLPEGTDVNFDVVLRTTAGNNNTIIHRFDTILTYTDSNGVVQTSEILDIESNQNTLLGGQPFSFFAIGTQGLSEGETFTLNGFTVSDAPTSSVPEPSSLLLVLAGSLSLINRRRR